MPGFTPRKFPSFLIACTLAALVWQAVHFGCVDKETEDIDTSEDDAGLGENVVCGKSFELDIEPFFASFCLGCHSENRIGAERYDAPEGMNFDTFEEVKTQADSIRTTLLDNGGMPPSPPIPSTMQRDDIISWIDCAQNANWQ